MRAKLALVIGTLAMLGLADTKAQAHWGVGIRIGIPICIPPCWGWGPYYASPPVFVQPAPVFVQPAPVFIQSAPVVYQAAPAYAPPAPAATQPAPTVRAVAPASAVTPAAAQTSAADDRQTEITHTLEHLRNPDEQARADAASRLGRLKAGRAVDPLAATLAGDSSPRVREAAAKALGMIGSAKALPALQRAAQNDGDRDVRHSAQFSVELVQAGR
jgi:hypothetical protein